MGFMQPQVFRCVAFVVGTSDGESRIIPADDVYRRGVIPPGLSVDDVTRDLSQYLETRVATWNVRTGYLARLSAPGYMDCTDYTIHETEDDARRYLVDTYDLDDDGVCQ